MEPDKQYSYDELIIAMNKVMGVPAEYDHNYDLAKMIDELGMRGVLESGETKKVHPIQMVFLKHLQTTRSQKEYTPQEQVCIAHCIKYGTYNSILHQDTLNKLRKKYGYENEL